MRSSSRREGLRRGRRSTGFFRRSEKGAAAAEMALLFTLLIPPLLNVVDIAVYAFRRMQVELAAEAGVQAVRARCSPLQAPVTQLCTTGLVTAITSAVQSTSLGSSVGLQAGAPKEGYFCVNSSGSLQLVGSLGQIGSPPVQTTTDCSSYGSAASPADYVQVSVTYAYTHLFPAVSVAGLLPSPVTRTAWYRVS